MAIASNGPAVGDHIEAVGAAPKPGRTLIVTMRQLEVFAVQDRQRKLVAEGQQTLICLQQRTRQ